MIHQLVCHPQMTGNAVTSIEVEAIRTEFGQLVLRYSTRGQIASLSVPAPVRNGSRLDGLWQTTCFEAFVKGASDQYVEINLSPSTGWAGYYFSTYRQSSGLLEIDAPPIDIDLGRSELIVTAAVDLSVVPLIDGAPWSIGLSAVIEETDGTKSYWSLRHPPGPPDFHHPDCFAFELPALGRA